MFDHKRWGIFAKEAYNIGNYSTASHAVMVLSKGVSEYANVSCAFDKTVGCSYLRAACYVDYARRKQRWLGAVGSNTKTNTTVFVQLISVREVIGGRWGVERGGGGWGLEVGRGRDRGEGQGGAGTNEVIVVAGESGKTLCPRWRRRILLPRGQGPSLCCEKCHVRPTTRP